MSNKKLLQQYLTSVSGNVVTLKDLWNMTQSSQLSDHNDINQFVGSLAYKM